MFQFSIGQLLQVLTRSASKTNVPVPCPPSSKVKLTFHSNAPALPLTAAISMNMIPRPALRANLVRIEDECPGSVSAVVQSEAHVPQQCTCVASACCDQHEHDSEACSARQSLRKIHPGNLSNFRPAFSSYPCFFSSSFAIASRCTSSGPSAKRSVRELAHAAAHSKSCEIPPPPCACIARSRTRSATFGATTLIIAISARAALLPTVSIMYA